MSITERRKECEDVLKNAQKILTADKFASSIGVALVEADIDYALCSLQIEDHHFNAAGSVQGGAIFTLADTALAIAANAGGDLVVSITNNISYLKATKGDSLFATARIVSSTKKICTYEIDVKDNLGAYIAKMVATCYIIKKKHL